MRVAVPLNTQRSVFVFIYHIVLKIAIRGFLFFIRHTRVNKLVVLAYVFFNSANCGFLLSAAALRERAGVSAQELGKAISVKLFLRDFLLFFVSASHLLPEV